MIAKIIFTDFDGVLNSQLYYTSGRHSERRIAIEHDIDPQSVGYLNGLIKSTDANVVITSSWRLERSIRDLQSILDKNGFVGKVIGKTRDLKSEEFGAFGDCILRGNEILDWLQNNQDIIGCSYSNYKHYAILDDASDILYCQRDNYFRIDPYCGLTPTVAINVERLLNS